MAFSVPVTLDEYDPDDDIFVRASTGGQRVSRFHVFPDCHHHRERSRAKDPATQHADLELCGACRYRLLDKRYTVGGEAFKAGNCRFVRERDGVDRLACDACDWNACVAWLPHDPFGLAVLPPRCPDCGSDALGLVAVSLTTSAGGGEGAST